MNKQGVSLSLSHLEDTIFQEESRQQAALMTSSWWRCKMIQMVEGVCV